LTFAVNIIPSVGTKILTESSYKAILTYINKHCVNSRLIPKYDQIKMKMTRGTNLMQQL